MLARQVQVLMGSPAVPSLMIAIKRAYEPAVRGDGVRVLVDRLWPRGLKKETAHFSRWMKELGPSDQLRRWFRHDPKRWEEFRRRYRIELQSAEVQSALDDLVAIAAGGKLTLVYGARDQRHNQAVVLKEVLDSRSATRGAPPRA